MSGRQHRLPIGRAWDWMLRALSHPQAEPPPRERQDGERCGTCVDFIHEHQDDHFGECARKKREGQGDLFAADSCNVSCADWCPHYREHHWHD